MDPIVAGGDLKRAVQNGHIAVGMDGIIGAVQIENAAFDGQGRSGLQALGAGVVGQGSAASAAGGHVQGGAGESQIRLRLDAVLPGIQGQGGVGDGDIA